MKKILEINNNGTLKAGINSKDEDDLLIRLKTKKNSTWGEIASTINRKVHKGVKIRTGKQVKERWNNHLNPEINRGPWSKLDDIKLLQEYKIHGNRWAKINQKIPERTESNIKNRVNSLLNKEKQMVTSQPQLEPSVDNMIMKLCKQVSYKNDIDFNGSVSPRSGRNSLFPTDYPCLTPISDSMMKSSIPKSSNLAIEERSI